MEWREHQPFGMKMESKVWMDGSEKEDERRGGTSEEVSQPRGKRQQESGCARVQTPPPPQPSIQLLLLMLVPPCRLRMVFSFAYDRTCLRLFSAPMVFSFFRTLQVAGMVFICEAFSNFGSYELSRWNNPISGVYYSRLQPLFAYTYTRLAAHAEIATPRGAGAVNSYYVNACRL